jgi:hypothetical protein
MKRALISAVIGIAVTALGLALAYVAYSSDEPDLACIFYWQGWLLQEITPSPNLGTPSHPVYEGTPLHVVAFFAGIPVGIVLYALAAFAVLSLIRKCREREKGRNKGR